MYESHQYILIYIRIVHLNYAFKLRNKHILALILIVFCLFMYDLRVFDGESQCKKHNE
jgi:hypothetical protein